jgi:hypothetical protein
VLDLLSEADVAAALAEAQRVLAPGRGRLLLTGITYGDSLSSHAACALWRLVRAPTFPTHPPPRMSQHQLHYTVSDTNSYW